LVEIIHFCLGATANPGAGVRREELAGWEFSLDLKIGGLDFVFTRGVDEPRWIYVNGDTDAWPVNLDSSEGRLRSTRDDHARALGRLMFGLTPEIEDVKFGPSFRSLFSYLARNGHEAFLSPFEHHSKQSEWDRQVNVAYHLALNWRAATRFQQIKEEKKALDQLRRLVREGNLPEYLGSEGALEAERVQLEQQIQARTEQLQVFQVREDYRLIEAEANRLTEEMHRLANANIRDARFVKLYAERLEAEEQTPVSMGDIDRLFGEADAAMPEVVVRRLDEVRRFHEAVVENRRAYLSDEIERLGLEVERRSAVIAELDSERAALLRIVESSGALEEFVEIQEQLAGVRSRLGEVMNRIARLRELEESRTAWEARRTDNYLGALAEYDEILPERDRAIQRFNENTQVLYESPGRLIIDVNQTGFKYDVEIERAESQGVSNMKIFCFDLMLMQLWAERGDGDPGVLIHDSMLFDGVDSRQVAAALELAASESERLGFQYICSMNSDALPLTIDVQSPIRQGLAIELHDRDPSGMLLGIEF